MKKSFRLFAFLIVLCLFAIPVQAQLNCSGGCPSGGGGSGTVNAGTAGELAYYNANGTTLDGMYPPLTQNHATDTSITPDLHVATTYIETALASAITVNAPLNVAHAGQTLLFVFTDNNTPRAITWNAIFRGSPTALTTANTTLYVLFSYNATVNKWDALADSGMLNCVVGGSSGDLQKNNGTSGCAASSINDNGTIVTMTEPETRTNVAAPSSPASGKDTVYTDSTDLRLHDKNASGVIGTTVVADTGASNNYLTGINGAGVITKARPTCGNLSDSGGGCSQTYTTGTTTSSATISPGTGNHIFYSVTALATGITTINAPGGSPAAGDTLLLTLKDTGSTQTITGWNAIYYAGSTIPFPTATTGGSILSMIFVYNPINSKYILQAVLDTN